MASISDTRVIHSFLYTDFNQILFSPSHLSNGISPLSIMTTSASRATIATSAIFMALASMAVVLRLYIRGKQKSPGSKADDWPIVAALVGLE